MRPFALAIALALTVAQCSVGDSPHPVIPAAWDPFLDTLQARTIQFFLSTSNPATGLVPDRYPSQSPSSIAAVGFGLTVLPIAVERGMITRLEAGKRVEKTLQFLHEAPQNDRRDGAAGYRGLFYHFIGMGNGTRVWNCELSTIDTGLLMAGVLFCQSYFDGAGQLEGRIRDLADSLYRRVDWVWAMGGSEGIRLGWDPERGFIKDTWTGYDESMILYILALGSPTYPVPAETWNHFTSPYVWAKYQGLEFVSFGPLFGHQFSHCWIDFRGIRDTYMQSRSIDYFENSRRATYSHRSYAIQNPGEFVGYCDSVWGLTACDGPHDGTISIDGRQRRFQTYAARGASVDWVNDDGTIAPTAAGGSVAFAPEICIPALKAMRNRHGGRLFREFGFVDAFNMTYTVPANPAGWFDKDYLGIDQGPIVLMIENLRNDFVWRLMRQNPYVIRGLQRAGFKGGWLEQ